MVVRVEDKSVEVEYGSDIAAALKQSLSGKRYRFVVAARIEGRAQEEGESSHG